MPNSLGDHKMFTCEYLTLSVLRKLGGSSKVCTHEAEGYGGKDLWLGIEH